MNLENINGITVLGLGYVGLPLAVEFSKKFPTIGFDISTTRVEQLKDHFDITGEIEAEELKNSSLKITCELDDIANSNVFIITVPTPIDKNFNPDLSPLISATKTVAKVIKKNSIVIYESTVYPGCTEDDMVPILEKESGLKYNIDFFCGYSPERMNPGDKNRTVTKIVKVTSGSTEKISEFVTNLYGSIVTAGTYNAGKIAIAEAAKVIENSQRDINIAFVNELAMIFEKLGLDTQEVLAAAGTKWNFLNFKPGLVGGHCIGVDPYYLTFKAQEIGYHPQMILAGRRINDRMGEYIAQQVIKSMIKKSIPVKDSKALILGITFKENCPDIRNSKVISIVDELREFGVNVSVYDPFANGDEVEAEYNLKLMDADKNLDLNEYQAIIFAVAHDQFKDLSLDQMNKESMVIYDVKGMFSKKLSDKRL
jgi:UDP-N-acetyl-D-galactosamine dehydrogenase